MSCCLKRCKSLSKRRAAIVEVVVDIRSPKIREGLGPDPGGGQGQGPEPGQGHPGGAKILALGLVQEGRLGNPDLRPRVATTTAATTTTRRMTRRRRRTPPRIPTKVKILISPHLFHLWKPGIHPLSLLLLYCCFLFWDLLSIQFQLWTNCL